MERAKLIASMFQHGASEIAGLFKSSDEALTASAAIDAMKEMANRPQPAPVVTVNVPPQPAPVIHLAAPAPAEAPVIHVHVPEPKPRSIKVETDGMGGKVYRTIEEA